MINPFKLMGSAISDAAKPNDIGIPVAVTLPLAIVAAPLLGVAALFMKKGNPREAA